MVKLSKDRKREIEKEVDSEILARKEEQYRERYKKYRDEGGLIGQTLKLGFNGFKAGLKLTKKALEDPKKGG